MNWSPRTLRPSSAAFAYIHRRHTQPRTGQHCQGQAKRMYRQRDRQSAHVQPGRQDRLLKVE